MKPSYHLEEYAGHKFYVEHIRTTAFGEWFRVYMDNGTVEDITTHSLRTIEETKEVVVDYICNKLKIMLEGKKYESSTI